MKIKKILSAFTAVCVLMGNVLATGSEIIANADYARVSVHDPSIIKLEDGDYYIIGSHLGAGRSDDMQNWYSTANSHLGSTATTFFKDIYTDLAVPEKWSNTTNGYNLAGNLWAPDIVYNKSMGKYCMYLSINGQAWNSSIVLCTADNIDGPYTYEGTIVYSGFTNNSVNNVNDTDVPKVLGKNPDISRYLSNGSWNASYGTNAIDPAVFYDENGSLRLVYGSWFGGIYMLELDEKTGLRDYNVKYETKADVSDAYMGKKVAGGNFASGEGPYIEYMKSPDSNKGYYYLFMSYGYFNSNGGYNMRIFRSENADGPYIDQNGNSAVYPLGGDNIGGTVGERLMSNYQWNCNAKPYKAQGHNSALMDDDGKLYVIYHTKFNDDFGAHEVRVHQMIMNEDGWPTATPYEYSGETLSENGHSVNAVTGDYEFIFHTLNQKFVNEQSADVEHPKNITLNENGTIEGDIAGTWSMQDNSPYMSLDFGGVTYKGAFIVQADESAEQVNHMTFTATGNNTCVWGSKKSEYNTDDDTVDLTNDNSSLVYAPETVTGHGSTVRLCNTSLLSGVSYTITNKNSGLLLDLTNGNTDSGSNIQQWTKIGGSAQEWRIVSEDNGYCRIVSMADESKCITVEENSAENGKNIELQIFTCADNQLWKFVQDGNYYGIVSKCSADKVGLDVFDWSTDNGGNINQWEYWGGDCQLWQITPVFPKVNDGKYTLRNVNSGLYIAGKDSNAVQSDAENWNIKSNGDGTYTIQSDNGKVLTVAERTAENGANISLESYNGNDSQKFTVKANKDGSYSLMSVVSGSKSCVDVFEISTNSGANLNQWEYWGGDGQKFIIEPVSTEKNTIIGDVNADGKFNIADAVMLQKWILSVPDTNLVDWKAGDLLEDGKLDVFDLCMMKHMLVK
ncbi:MAG: RICIN domain-containing protein [Prevotella sp.]|nr:RICIN domain-containing protein [Alistipes senegalensis]MCM1357227.1 RICIN domain-containing protein [Prevotella sp.]MCM1472857.1 RICIN domain-containing protein [Muribaculaceae bacterium]